MYSLVHCRKWPQIEVRVIPESLKDVVLHLGHNQSWHNRYQRTYAAIKHLYYWKAWDSCIVLLQSCKPVQYKKSKRPIWKANIWARSSANGVCKYGLIGEFHPPSSKGNRYALTAVCMLTGYTFCIPLRTNQLRRLRPPGEITSPSRLVFVENYWWTTAQNLKWFIFQSHRTIGSWKKIYSPPYYRPQSNGRIEGFHRFLKSCLAKHISRHCEWDDVVPLATASYNWLPNQHSKESPFFVMFGRDAVTNLSQLTKPKLRYMGTEDLILDLKLMSNIFQTQIHNLRMARERVIEGQQLVTKPNIEVGDLVLVRDHTSRCFMPKYKVDFRVVRVQGNRAEVKDNNGKLTWYHISDIKKTDMVTKLICQLPDVDAFGRTGRLSFDPERVKDLGWVPNDWTHKFNPDHVKEATPAVKNTPKERSHQMELRSRNK